MSERHTYHKGLEGTHKSGKHGSVEVLSHWTFTNMYGESFEYMQVNIDDRESGHGWGGQITRARFDQLTAK